MSEPVKTKYPPGHFYSPVVNPSEVGDYVRQLRLLKPEDLAGIDIDISAMREFWVSHVAGGKLSLPRRTKAADRRYYTENASFGIGDAIILGAMIASDRPSRIIEVGSGFSTLHMLDVIDECGLRDTQITVIDPYLERLRKMVSADDLSRLQLMESPVQSTDLSVFTALKAGDMLFIDSTHVLKTGSDVHFELTRVLPALPKGVRVHFHDVQWPFEYPSQWINDLNLSWNESYAIQLFLMYNRSFSITFFNNLFGRYFKGMVTEAFPTLGRPPDAFGGSLWLVKN